MVGSSTSRLLPTTTDTTFPTPSQKKKQSNSHSYSHTPFPPLNSSRSNPRMCVRVKQKTKENLLEHENWKKYSYLPLSPKHTSVSKNVLFLLLEAFWKAHKTGKTTILAPGLLPLARAARWPGRQTRRETVHVANRAIGWFNFFFWCN